jgi:hypothetical protein
MQQVNMIFLRNSNTRERDAENMFDYGNADESVTNREVVSE